MRIGLVGLGRMGSAILPRLIAGCTSVAAWNRTPGKLAEAKALGAKTAKTPQELVGMSDVVLSIVYDDAAVEEVYTGASGLLSGDCKGRLFIEMSTIRLDTIRKIDRAVSKQGGCLVDAPVSGSVGPAREGKLLVLIGGSDVNVERATSVLKLISRRIAHLGPLGSGLALKLGIQALIYAYWQALGEALAIGSRAGLDLPAMLDVIADSPAALAALKSKMPAIAGMDNEIAFALSAATKDLGVIVESSQSLGLSSAIIGKTLDCYKRATDAGRGENDIAGIVSFTMNAKS